MEQYELAENIPVDSSFNAGLVILMVFAMAGGIAGFYLAQGRGSPVHFYCSRAFNLWAAHGSPGALDRLSHLRFCYFPSSDCFRRDDRPSGPCFIRADQRPNDAFGAAVTPSLFITNPFQRNFRSNQSQQSTAYSIDVAAYPS